VADAIFEEPRLAEIYDPLEPDRPDLDAYAALAEEFSAVTVLDVGCGTGTFACLLAGRGLKVIAVDPTAASLDVARRKTGAGGVRWLHADAAALPPLQVNLVTMTGNVARARLHRAASGMTANPPGVAAGDHVRQSRYRRVAVPAKTASRSAADRCPVRSRAASRTSP
jgi:SAM-dependent methyltransferase